MRRPINLLLVSAASVLGACDGDGQSGGSTSLPRGALILMPATCPNGFSDATGRYNGRLIAVDTNAVDEPILKEGDGAHSHSGGDHDHPVTGNVNEPGEGYREGNGGRRSSGIRSPIVGTAQSRGHTHDAGAHVHASVGLRLCQK